MTNVADLLDLPREATTNGLWVVASNGAVIFRYPPLEVRHEETFDASEAVRQVLEHHPERAGRRRGARRRLPRQPSLPRRRALRRHDRDRARTRSSASRSAA